VLARRAHRAIRKLYGWAVHAAAKKGCVSAINKNGRSPHSIGGTAQRYFLKLPAATSTATPSRTAAGSRNQDLDSR